MGTARTIAIKLYIKRHGLKLSWVAHSLGMSEGLLRYHLKQGFDRPEMVAQFKELMRAHAQAVLDDLEEVQSPETLSSK